MCLTPKIHLTDCTLGHPFRSYRTSEFSQLVLIFTFIRAYNNYYFVDPTNQLEKQT